MSSNECGPSWYENFNGSDVVPNNAMAPTLLGAKLSWTVAVLCGVIWLDGTAGVYFRSDVLNLFPKAYPTNGLDFFAELTSHFGDNDI